MTTIDPNMEKLVQEALAGAKPRPLHRVLFNLADCYNQSAEMALSRITTSGNADFAAPAIMCRSFAVELLLKFFIVVEHPMAKSKAELEALGVNVHGHPYSGLYDRINANHQSLIASKHSTRTGHPTSTAEFRNLLLNLGDDPFVGWRYVYESPSAKHIDIALLASVVDSLGLAAQDATRSAPTTA
jgi:hypothetical protein